MEKNNHSHTILIVLVALTFLLSLANFLGFSLKSGSIGTELEKIEAMKVGGDANYKLVKQIYDSKTFKDQQGEMLKNALGQLENPTAAQPQAQEQLPLNLNESGSTASTGKAK